MRPYDNEFLIDGQPVLVPDEGVQINLEDLDSSESGRDESGVMHRIVVREKVRKYSLPYGLITKEEYTYMMSLFVKDIFPKRLKSIFPRVKSGK